MGDLKEEFKAMNEYKKKRKEEKEKYYVPLLKKAGAKLVNCSTWMLGDYLCFSSTGMAMHKRNRKKTSINKVLKEQLNEK